MPPAGKRMRAEAVAVPKRDQIISAWLLGVLEPRTNMAAAQRMVYPTETVFTAPYVTHITVRVEHPPCLLCLRRPALSPWSATLLSHWHRSCCMRRALAQEILRIELRVAGEQGELTPSMVLTWLRKLFPDHHEHTYKSHEQANIEQVRLKSLSFRLSEDGRSLRFEITQAVVLSTLSVRLPADWLSSPTRKYPILWQKAYAEEAATSGLAPAPASAALASTSSSVPAPRASAAATSAAASAAPASAAPIAGLAEAAVPHCVPAEDEEAASDSAEAAEGAVMDEPASEAADAEDAVDGAAAAASLMRPPNSSSSSNGGKPQSSKTVLETCDLETPRLAHPLRPSGLGIPTDASVTTFALSARENLTTLNKAEANNQLRSLTIKYHSLQEEHAALRQQQDSFKLLQSRAYFDEARNAIVFRVVAGTQHTFKLELTRRLPSLDEPPVDEIKLTKVSTQPAPYGAKAANPIEYGLYDEDAADSLKSRERSTRAIRPPRPLDARYYGFSDVGQAFCMKLYYMPHPAARTLREAMLLHSDKARALLACWAKGGKTTSKETFTMMVPAVFGLFAFEEGDVHALFDELKSDKDELPHDELKDRLAAGGRDWALALGPAVDPIPKADLDFNFQEGYAQVSVLVRLTEPWHPPPSRHAQNIPSPGGAASGSERGASQSQ